VYPGSNPDKGRLFALNKLATIIVLTRSISSDHTKKCVEAIERNTSRPYELFVLRDDPGSFGFSKDNNRIMRIAEGKYLVLVNDDCFVSPNWLDKMIAKAESDPKIGLVGAKLYGLDGKIQYHADWTNEKGEVENIAFALVLITRQVIEKIGFLNEYYRFGAEDSEYCILAKKAGFKLAMSDATALHIKNTSLDAKTIYLKTRGAFAFERTKGLPLPLLMFYIGWDSTYAIRKYMQKRVPSVFQKLRVGKYVVINSSQKRRRSVENFD
jgi:GT2 family glycosyltransferase